jgi:hypothetical protein
LNKTIIKKDAELMHYGVKGMKWGVRKDDRSERRSRASNYKARRIIDDQTLQKSISRMQLEKQYKKLVMEDLNPGKAFVSDILPKFGATAVMAAGGTIGAKLAKEFIKNKLGG